MAYKLGSLFDGSGGFPLAGSLCGIEPRWAAEVEPYPIAVTRSRFPQMRHLGDISKVNGAEIEPVDIITFGSPCQDLSVAGKRAGLKHEANGDEETTRSGLFMEAVRIIKEMRRATNGEYPSFALWENVPGAFSSNKGEDFRIVLEELIKIVEPSAVMPGVPKAGWAYADSYRGHEWSLAYRVFDAQYWGVPQRRRRIHLVLDLRGERAREVLFEREGVRGYFAEGGTPWKAVTADAQGSTGTADREGAVGLDGYNSCLTGEVSSTLGVNCGMSTGRNGVVVPYLLKIRSGVEVDANGKSAGKGALIQTDMSATLGTSQYLFQPVAYSFDSLASNSMKSSNPHSGCRQVEVAKTLDTTDPNPSKNQGGIAVVEAVKCYDIGEARLRTPSEYDEVTPTITARCGTGGNNTPAVVYCLQGNGIDRADTAGCNGKGWKEDACYTLNTIDRPAVAYLASGKETVGTLMANAGTKLWLGNQEAFSGDYHIIEEHEPPAVRYIVRRLTPTECARLQGFADRWGDIDEKDSFTPEEFAFWHEVRNTHATVIGGKEAKEYTEAQMLTWYNKLHTDSAEYKMWGNGIALPPALYVLQGMTDVFEKEVEDDWML